MLTLGVFLDCYSFFIEVGPFTACCSGYSNKLTCSGNSLFLFPLHQDCGKATLLCGSWGSELWLSPLWSKCFSHWAITPAQNFFSFLRLKSYIQRNNITLGKFSELRKPPGTLGCQDHSRHLCCGCTNKHSPSVERQPPSYHTSPNANVQSLDSKQGKPLLVNTHVREGNPCEVEEGTEVREAHILQYEYFHVYPSSLKGG